MEHMKDFIITNLQTIKNFYFSSNKESI
jgi:hypothetical protein